MLLCNAVAYIWALEVAQISHASRFDALLWLVQDPELKAAFSILQQLWNKGYEVSCYTRPVAGEIREVGYEQAGGLRSHAPSHAAAARRQLLHDHTKCV